MVAKDCRAVKWILQAESMSQQQSLVALLPTEVIIEILQDLDVPTLLRCKQVSTDPCDLPRFLKLILLFFRSVDHLLPSSKALWS